jgi:DNA-binding CsgD family transcriptional regulator
VSRPDPERERSSRAARHARTWGLTPAQARVLEGVAAGLSNKELAERLGVLEGTVEAHLAQVFRKSGTSQRGELVARFWAS